MGFTDKQEVKILSTKSYLELFCSLAESSEAMENGFSSSRSDAFPAGLRVLVVDDDLTWLKILEKMLKKCSYEVTTCCLARDALSLLRGRKGGYDIVISDVNMPDMDGFKLLEHVGLEMDLPVIMMSVDGETSRVMKGVQHGACDYLLKPITMKELRNIWQHVLRKKIHEVRDVEAQEGVDILQLMRHGSDQTEDLSLFLSGEDLGSVRKRKDLDTKHSEFGDSSKKHRVVWTVELHQKFVEAVNHMGLDKVGPKRILDAMKVPWLTRENVASHLQKYRLYLSRLQNESDPKTPPKDTPEEFSLQNSTYSLKNDAADPNLAISNNVLDATSQEGNSEAITPISVLESKRRALESEIQPSRFDSANPTRYGWGEAPEVQLKQEHEPFLQFEDHPAPSSPENHILLGNESNLTASLDEDLQFSWLQGDNDIILHNIDFSEDNDFHLLSEAPLHLYDALRFDYECPLDPIIF